MQIRFYNSLRWRLSLLFVLAIAASGLVQLYFSTQGWRKLVEEIEQQIHWDLAADLVEEIQPEVKNEFVPERIERLLFNLTVSNPKREFLLLDGSGGVIAAIPYRSQLVRRTVNLEPLRRALDHKIPPLPIYGDDPFQGEGATKVFSVARIIVNNQPGYLYIPLISSTFDFLVRHTGQMYLLQIVSVGLIISWLFALSAGFLLFALLSRRFRGLSGAIDGLREGRVGVRAPVGREDEVGLVARAFNEMADTILANTEELKRKDRMRRELIANISHDLRGPVTSILAHIEALRERASAPEQRDRYLNVIEENAQTQRNLVEDLFLLSTLEAKEQRSDMDYCSIERIVKSVADALLPAAEKRGLALEVEFAEALPLIYADSRMIHRVLFNLVSNAIRYSRVNGQVVIAADTVGSRVRVSVKDQGIGIPATELPYIFDSFYRANTHRPEDPGGTGLGLAIVKKLLALHRSVPEVESRVDEGTEVSFTLPCEPEPS